MVLSHGDVISPNVILTTLGYRLIDWEALSIYPKSLTLSHAICWTILRIPTDRWQRFLKVVLPDCLKTMGLDEDQARLSIYWQVMREALLWARNEKRFSEWLKKGEFVFN